MIRVQLTRSWKHPYKAKPYSVGTILQLAPYLAMELMADKKAMIYKGEYPPKGKKKIELSQLNGK